MAKPYDVTTKFLVENNPRDWVRYLRFPDGPVQIEDTDLTTLVAEADKVLRVLARHPYLLHLEFQSGPDATLDERTLLYNVLLRNHHHLPVKSVLILLRKKADSGKWTGILRYTDPDDDSLVLEFHYRVIRVWEMPVEQILRGRLATLPLAPLTNVARPELPGIIRRMKARVEQEATPAEAREIWSATYILMGLKYAEAFAQQLLRGVQTMKDSTTYQAIIREGEEQGRLAEAHNLLLRMGNKRFGPPTAAEQAALASIASLEKLEQLAERLLEVENWQELLAFAGLRINRRTTAGKAALAGLLIFPVLYYLIQFNPRYTYPMLWLDALMAGDACFRLLRRFAPATAR